MPHRNEQPTLFELTAFEEFEPFRKLPPEGALPSVTSKSDPPMPEGSASARGPEGVRAVSPWASMPLHEVCVACGCKITGTGFVILDYEELGAFCDQDCGDRRFRSYLYESEEGTGEGVRGLAVLE